MWSLPAAVGISLWATQAAYSPAPHFSSLLSESKGWLAVIGGREVTTTLWAIVFPCWQIWEIIQSVFITTSTLSPPPQHIHLSSQWGFAQPRRTASVSRARLLFQLPDKPLWEVVARVSNSLGFRNTSQGPSDLHCLCNGSASHGAPRMLHSEVGWNEHYLNVCSYIHCTLWFRKPSEIWVSVLLMWKGSRLWFWRPSFAFYDIKLPWQCDG